jgi:hypothetical protein
MTRRPDSYPAPYERAILEGRSLTAEPSPSPGYALASAVRRLNAKLGAMPPEQVAALQTDWVASFEELQRQLDSATDDPSRHDLIARWRDHWGKRLGFNFNADHTFSYRRNN